jgi:periplasmic protein TonB
MAITVNHDGRIVDTEVVQTSGNHVLDRRATTIARAAGPFGKFNSALRQKADLLVMVALFKFTRDDTLETKLTNR